MHAVATEPFFRQIGFDIRVVAFAFVLAVIAPLAFAIVPTLRVLRHDVRSSLTDATARSVGGAAAARGRSALVVLQVSLAVMLLVVAGLVVRSMNAVMRIDLGYDPTRLLSAEVEVPAWKEGDDLAALRLRQRLLDARQADPRCRGRRPRHGAPGAASSRRTHRSTSPGAIRPRATGRRPASS